MRIPIRLASLLMAAAFCGSMLAGCSQEYPLQITNHRGQAASVEIEQYCGDPPGSGPPREYTPALRLRRELVSLAPGEARTVKFLAASGGFWLRWRALDPLAQAPAFATIDLLRDAPVIDVR